MPRHTTTMKIIEAAGGIRGFEVESRQISEELWLHHFRGNQEFFLSKHESPEEEGITQLRYRTVDGRVSVQSSVTLSQYRGAGYATRLYVLCVEHFGTLYSDGIVSRSAQKVWERMASEGQVKVELGKARREDSPHKASLHF
ncbi:MAG: hypothetical protein EOP06_00855 [Proteobacteria bacterium]|nr:MAG: hypothetical protein EOP06_00855 [Pseudomonadota bacterium]